MRSLLTALLLLSAPAATAESAPTPVVSSGQDTFFQQLFATRFFNSGRPGNVQLAPDEQTVFFLRNSAASPALSLHAFDVATGQTREVLTPEQLLRGAMETLSPEEKARRERMRMSARGFGTYALSEDGAKLLLGLSGKLYVVTRATGKVTELATGPGAMDPRFSPDGTQVAYVREQDVYRVDLATNTEHRVTKGGTPERTHGLAEFVAQEEMYRFTGYWWSPDAKSLAYTESDTSGVEKLSLVDPSRPEQGAQQVSYPRAGKANAKVRLGLIPVKGGKTTWVSWDAETYPYLATVRWPEKGPLTLLVQNRAQTEERLLAVDPKTGATRTLLVEKSETWLDLDQTFPRWLKDGSGFLWHTERNGAPEVELRDAKGQLVRSLIPPSADFEELVGYVEQEDTAYFVGGPGTGERYLWRVKAGAAPVRVTTGGPAREMGRMSRQGGLLLLTTEGPTSMRRTLVMKPDGTTVGELPSVAQEPPFKPRMEVRRVGKAGYPTMVLRPRDARPGVKLPVIVEIYAGPGTSMVRQGMAENLLSQWLADQGFLVVKLDAPASLRKPKYDFARVLLDEQVAALRELAKEVPELDLTRVGITGSSHGGYMSALAALTRPDVFKAAVAVSSVVDWRDYDTHLTERFLGLPQEQPEAYERSSLLTHVKAGAPMGKLLLVHGTADDNVFFFHSLKLSDALFRAGQPHGVLPLSGVSHMIFADPLAAEQLWRRTAEYFRENL